MCGFWKTCSSRPGVVVLLKRIRKPAVALKVGRATTTGTNTKHTATEHGVLVSIVAPFAQLIAANPHGVTRSRKEVA